MRQMHLQRKAEGVYLIIKETSWLLQYLKPVNIFIQRSFVLDPTYMYTLDNAFANSVTTHHLGDQRGPLCGSIGYHYNNIASPAHGPAAP